MFIIKLLKFTIRVYSFIFLKGRVTLEYSGSVAKCMIIEDFFLSGSNFFRLIHVLGDSKEIKFNDSKSIRR